MHIQYHRIPFIVHIAGPAVRNPELLVDGDLGVGGAAGFYGAGVDGHGVALEVAGAAEVDLGVDRGAVDGGVGAAALMQGELVGLDAALEVAGAGQADGKIGSVDAAVHINVAGAGGAKVVNILKRDKGLHLAVIPTPIPMEAVCIEVYVQDAILDFGDDPVAQDDVGGADGHTIFRTLFDDKVDGVADVDAVKGTDLPFLDVGRVDKKVSLVLGPGEKTNQQRQGHQA